MADRLRFRREPYKTGLAAVGQGIRGYELYYGDILMASVRPAQKHSDSSWYWHTMAAKPYANTCYECTALEQAKEAARAHVKKYIESLK